MNHQSSIRRRSILIQFLLSSLLLGDSASAFSPLIPFAHPSTSVQRTSVIRFMAVSSSPRLSHEEELELLRQTTEMFRIQRLEAELALKTRNQLPLLSIRAQAAGYGHDLDGYEFALDAGHVAREKLVSSNMGLVHYCVNEILKTQAKSQLGTLSREDLIQEGAIGLSRAVSKYNIGIGGKLSSYAVYWIRAAILRCIAERGDVVRVPEHVSVAIRKMTAAAKRLGLQVDGDTIVKGVFTNDQPWKDAQNAKILAEEAGLTDRQLKEALKVNSRRRSGSISFEDWMQKGQDLMSDVTSNFDSMPKPVDSIKLRTELSKYLGPQEIEALTLRYGLESSEAALQNQEQLPYNYQAKAEALIFQDEPQSSFIRRKKSGEMTFHEIGKSMSVSAEYGRRLVHRALTKLQKAAAEGQLEPAFLS